MIQKRYNKSAAQERDGVVVIIKIEVCECRKNVRETGDGRTTDRPPLLYGQFVSPRTGTSPLQIAGFIPKVLLFDEMLDGVAHLQ